MGDEERFNNFITWFRQAVADQEPKIIVRGMTGLGNFFRANFEDQNMGTSHLNNVFQEAIGSGLNCLDKEAFVTRGLETQIFDALGDIV